jgi:hypothetical protein
MRVGLDRAPGQGRSKGGGQVGPAHPRILLAHPRIKVKHIKNKIQSDQQESKSEQALQIIGHVVAKSYAHNR